MNASNIRIRLRRIALVATMAIAIASFGVPAALAADCQEPVVVVQVAGSGNGLAPPILFTRIMAETLPDTEVEVVQVGAAGHDLGYPAMGFPYSNKWFGLWGTPSQRVDNYNGSVDQGVGVLEHVIAGRYSVSIEGCRPLFVLVGYSQGAQVVRQALPDLEPYGASIASVVLIGDPTFDPDDLSLKFGGSLGPPSDARVGFLTVLGQQPVALPEWVDERTTSICVRSDPVCQQYRSRLLAPVTALKFVLSPFHRWGYTSNVLGPPAGLVGFTVRQAVAANA